MSQHAAERTSSTHSRGNGNKLKIGKGSVLGLGIKLSAILSLTAVFSTAAHLLLFAGQTQKLQLATIPVRYTDVRKDAGITFLQDATQTEEKYYLETMGTGVAWLDYDQDGLMDLFAPATLCPVPQ